MIIQYPPKAKRTGLWSKTRAAILILISLVTFSVSTAQSTNISGIVNSYFQVIEIIPAKACVRVSDPTGLVVNTRVMLIQMKGATINTSTGSSFGDTSSLNQAGNYEVGTICFLDGDSVFLFHELLNSYDYATGKVQLVQFAEYYTAVVTDTVKAAPWDSVAGTGGVIAIFCDQDLTLNAPIYADSSGYRGGKRVLHIGSCSNFFAATLYAYNPNDSSLTQTGAYKGESVANLSITLSGGRGAPANGGGGGNNHNNSGGGGANLVAGGRGGGNASTTGCTTTLRGEAGKALSSWTGQKIFLGGGGGAGHANFSGSVSKGGNGGGIIFLWALNLNGNNQSISARGGAGGNSTSDGAGGGGAGGTIIMHITSYAGNVSIQADGGKGGDSDNAGNPDRCYGGGGGGSGGMLYFTGSTPAVTTSVVGGVAGIESNSFGTCGSQPALAGSNGQIISSYNYMTSTDPAAYCELLLPVQLEYFRAYQQNDRVLLQWKVLNPADIELMIVERSATGTQWTPMEYLDPNTQLLIYNSSDEQPFISKTYYRIRFIEKNQRTSYSPVRLVSFLSTQEFLIFPNPAKDKIEIITSQRLPVEMLMYELSGKLLIRKGIHQSHTTINTSSLAKGVYILEINGARQKLVIH